MEDNNSLELLREFVNNTYKYLDERRVYVLFILIVILLVCFTYYYSQSYRTNSITEKLLNTFKYTHPRKLIDFCGEENRTKDRIFAPSLTINLSDNTIEIDDPNLNLRDRGLSSEHILFIEKTDEYDGQYKIDKILSANKILIAKETPLNKEIKEITEVINPSPTFAGSTTRTNVIITYYRPDDNLNIYKYKKLTDYYVSSSFKSCLVGYQKADYCSLDMINRVIHFGARYIELEVFNKEIKNDTIPIVSSGYAEGSTRVILNWIELEDCLDLISKMAFSEAYIDNFNDPMFIYFNLKVNGNHETLNKIAELINKYLSSRLLGKQHLNTNIGNTTLCDLKGKVVILSSGGYIGSKLEDLVNSSTASAHLKRLTFTEMMNYSEMAKPKFTIRKNTIKFSKGGANSTLEFTGNDVDLIKLGMVPGDNVVITSAKRVENNSGSFLFKVENRSKNRIIFNKAVKLANELPGSMVKIEVYDASFTGSFESLEEYNKSNITICIPDDRFFSNNYNYKEAMYKGCQFIAMNYQNKDTYMESYFDMFMESAFQFKSSALIHEQKLPKIQSLGSISPKDKGKLKYDTDYSFKETYINKTITISTEAYPNLKLGISELDKSSTIFPAKMVLDANKVNMEFKIVNGLDNSGETISFKLANNVSSSASAKYLHYNEQCCFLSYEPNEENNEYKRQTSFIPLKSLNRELGFNSFAVKMTKKVGRDNKQILYYLKHKKNFEPKLKLFKKISSTYNVKMRLRQNSTDPADPADPANDVVVLTPILVDNVNFLSLGDIVVPLRNLRRKGSDTSTTDPLRILPNQPIKSLMVNGAATHPVDFVLVFENRYFKSSNNQINTGAGGDADLSIWKPIPQQGYTALGYVFQNSYSKPEIESIYCVSNDFIKEEPYDTSGLFYGNEEVFDHQSASVNMWTRDTNNDNSYIKYYVAVNNVRSTDSSGILAKPNPFDYPYYIVADDSHDYIDRIYIDNVIENTKEDKQSCNFKIELSNPPSNNDSDMKYDKLLEIEGPESKLFSYARNAGGSGMCVGLPQPYLSSYYEDLNYDTTRPADAPAQDNRINSELKAMACGNSDTFSTNFRYYNDTSIRLASNNKFCMTHMPDANGNPNKDINDPNNFLYLDKCKDNLENQMFIIDDFRLRAHSETTGGNNSCVTITPENDIRLEECGDQKFTALHLWDDQIIRADKCLKNQAIDSLKDISAIEVCEDNSYYIIYLDGLIKTEEHCSREEADLAFNRINDKIGSSGIASVILVHKGEVIKNSDINDIVTDSYKSKIESLSLNRGDCYQCKTASRMLCSNGRMQDTIYNRFTHSDEEMRLNKYCMTMRDNSDFKCGKSTRQKFFTFPVPENYCLNVGKTVWIQCPDILEVQSDKDKFDRADADAAAGSPTPVSNLLNERYDTKYSVFLKATLRASNNRNDYKIEINIDDDTPIEEEDFTITLPTLTQISITASLLNSSMIDVSKGSDYICLDYIPRNDMLYFGAKVLVFFDEFILNTTTPPLTIAKKNVKYLGVVIGFVTEEIVKVMLSLNSYESDTRRTPKVGTQHYSSNPIIETHISKVTLFKKAEQCI